MSDLENTRERNRLLVRALVLPTIFLTVALLGGLRVSGETSAFQFAAPPLVALLLAVLLLLLFVRGHLLDLNRWLASDHPALANVSHALTLIALFFASAQAFNSVLPERGLFRWLFGFFFLWTLWNNLFATFDAQRLLRSLAVLFGTAFVLKHLLLANLYAADGGWLHQLAGAIFEGVTQGTLGAQERIAPASGYISFFTLVLYIAGLILLPSAPESVVSPRETLSATPLIDADHQLSSGERVLPRDSLVTEKRSARRIRSEDE